MLTAGTRDPIQLDWFLWVRSRNWTTGAIEAAGLWTGATAQLFTIEGETREYQGGGGVVEIDQLSYGIGVGSIQSQSIRLNGLGPEVEALFRGYDANQAVAQIHRMRRTAGVSTPGVIERAFSGKVDSLQFSRSATNSRDGVVKIDCTVSLMSASRSGTRTLELKRSDASQRLVDANDRGRRYTSVKAKVAWMAEVDNPYHARQRIGTTTTTRDV